MDNTEINLSKQDDCDVSDLAIVVHADPTGGARVGCCTITEVSFSYTKTAICDFPGNLTGAGTVTGGTIFLREKLDGTVEVFGEVSGLTDGDHGIHIHENGGLGNSCVDAGGHFDPDSVSPVIYRIRNTKIDILVFRLRLVTMDFMLEILEVLHPTPE